MNWSLGNEEALRSYFLINRTVEPGLLWLSVLGPLAPSLLSIPPDTPHAQAEVLALGLVWGSWVVRLLLPHCHRQQFCLFFFLSEEITLGLLPTWILSWFMALVGFVAVFKLSFGWILKKLFGRRKITGSTVVEFLWGAKEDMKMISVALKYV